MNVKLLRKKAPPGHRPDAEQFLERWVDQSFDANNLWFVLMDAMNTVQMYKRLDGNEKKRWVLKVTRTLLERSEQENALKVLDLIGETTIDFIVFLSKHKNVLLKYPCQKCLPL